MRVGICIEGKLTFPRSLPPLAETLRLERSYFFNVIPCYNQISFSRYVALRGRKKVRYENRYFLLKSQITFLSIDESLTSKTKCSYPRRLLIPQFALSIVTKRVAADEKSI